MGAAISRLHVACYHCGKRDAVKAARHGNGKQRYKCRSCGRYFIDPALRVKRTGPLPSAGHLVLKLKALAQRLGRTPTREDIRRQVKQGWPYRERDFNTVFGSHQAALKKAGLTATYRRVFSEHEKEIMLGQIRRVSEGLGRPVSTDDVRLARRVKQVAPVTHLEKAFGSIRNAIDAAGVGVKVHYTDEEMIRILRQVDMTLDRPVRSKDLVELHRQGKAPSPKVLVARFGGMAKARAAAGIKQKFRFANGKTGTQQRYSRDELIEQLKSLGQRLGRKPSFRDIVSANRTECACVPTFSNMFGSLRDAFQAAGFDVRPLHYTDKELIAMLRALRRKLGHFPTYSEITAAYRAGQCPTAETVVRRLGNLSEIKERI
jgi:hypothetical protein